MAGADEEILAALRKAALGYEDVVTRTVQKKTSGGGTTVTKETTVRNVPPNASAAQLWLELTKGRGAQREEKSKLSVIKSNRRAKAEGAHSA